MPAPEYWHQVMSDSPVQGQGNCLYDGTDAADAMAAWSKAVSEGDPYVTLESLIRPRVRIEDVPLPPDEG
jgi:hypothetical protein